MAVTPEGKIKQQLKRLLNDFVEHVNVDGFTVRTLKEFWPVPSGYGASDLDCLVCYYGLYIAIETKAPGEKPTARQKLTIAETKGAGGMTFVIDGEQSLFELRAVLQGIKDANHSKR